jgi:hypothetical protein
MSDTDARQFILKARGKRYDPSVVDAFLNVFGNAPAVKVDDLELGSHELRPGMVLARNVTSSEGVVLLTANYTLSEHLIRQLRDFEQTEGRRLTFYVLPPDKVLQS